MNSIPYYLSEEGQQLLAVNRTYPKPTGPYSVGTGLFYLTDCIRSHPLYHTEPRQLAVRTWYPAMASGSRRLAADPEGLITRHLNNQVGCGLFDFVSRLETNGLVDAPVDASAPPMPIAVFAHGYGGVETQNTIACENLASHGFAVFGISFTHDSLVSDVGGWSIFQSEESRQRMEQDKDAAQTEAERLAISFDKVDFLKSSPAYVRFLCSRQDYSNHLVHLWKEDIRFVLDALKSDEGTVPRDLADRLDPDRIVLFGHSMGGAAVGLACAENSGISAGVNIDGVQYGGGGFLTPGCPFSAICQEPALIRAGYGAPVGNFLKVKGVTHEFFTDLVFVASGVKQLLSPADTADGIRAACFLRDYLLAFFQDSIEGVQTRTQNVLHGYSDMVEVDGEAVDKG
jgi:dienelactone hydrolase